MSMLCLVCSGVVHSDVTILCNARVYTTSDSEKKRLVSQSADGWIYEGVAWYAGLAPETPVSPVPVYEFRSPASSSYFYPASEAQKNSLLQSSAEAWTYEGVAYYAFVNNTQREVVPVYRLWSDTLASHRYTTDGTERNNLLTQNGGLWTYEGIAFYCYNEAAPSQTSTSRLAVYRLGSTLRHTYFYTSSVDEKDRFVDLDSDPWTDEGIAWYACLP
jgi:hypothetical protein